MNGPPAVEDRHGESGERRGLDEVRRELQRLGYLSHRVERFLLQDALVPRDPWRGLPRLAAKVGLLAGSLLAAVHALALAAANDVLARSPADLLPLFAHLFPPLVLGAGVGFVALVAGWVGVSRAFPRRSLDVARFAIALGATALLVGGGVALGWEFLVGLPRLGRAAAAAAVPLAAAGLAKLLADGLLAFGIRWTRRAPAARAVPRRVVTTVVAGTVALLAAVALFAPHAAPAAAPAALPSAPGERVVLVGVDGVLPGELDYLLASGGLPALSDLLRGGGALASYAREPDASPAEFWTTVATGQPARRHGVVALDSFRPLGLDTALARTGPWRIWFARVEEPLGLAEYRPLLSSRRRAPFVWELAARGGRPVAAIGWWATFPAEPLPGLVVAHGAYGLLAGDAAGVVAPPERRAELARAAAATTAGSFAPAITAALPPEARDAALARAALPDRWAAAVARGESGAGAGVVAVYLPALDLIAAESALAEPQLAELAAAALGEVDGLVAELARGAGTTIVVFDPGRRGGGEGRALVARPGCAAGARPALEPAAVASGLLRAAGLPQSRELPPPPGFCTWPEPPAVVDGYGERRSAATAGEDPDAYLESLRSLGYL